MERRTFLKLAALVPGLALAGCGGSKTLLSPKDPTMLSIWHVYGEQADSPMNRLLTEFNDTVGREKGILLNVTNMTNSAAIGGQLQDAKVGKPGALDLPDLFSAHSADASALGIENLVDWNDWFTAEDMAAYVPGFVQDGMIDGRQVVFPVSKSTQLIFLNGSQYARFAADTEAQLSTLATWDGFFEMAGAYRQWSQGKPFCALDYPPASGGAERAGAGQRRAVQGKLVRSDQRDLPRFVDGVCPGAGAGRYSDLGPVLQHAGDDRRDAGGPWQLCGHPLLQ